MSHHGTQIEEEILPIYVFIKNIFIEKARVSTHSPFLFCRVGA